MTAEIATVIRRSPPADLPATLLEPWKRECGTKTLFFTRVEARKTGRAFGQRHRAYKCRFGDHWHVSSKPRRSA
jgi:hypothetical protein